MKLPNLSVLAFVCLALSGCGDDAKTTAASSGSATPALTVAQGECPPPSGIPINERGPLPSASDTNAYRCEVQDRAAQGAKEREEREARLAAEAARVSQRAGGDPAQALDKLHVAKGGTLKKLLQSHGLKITHISAQEVKPSVMPGTQAGDVLFTLELAGKAKGMPCGLNEYVGEPVEGENPFITEVLYRNGKQVLDDRTDPLMYWAATGKCSPNT